MSAIEEAFARLEGDEERALWQRAAEAAQAENSTDSSRNDAQELTLQLVRLGRTRQEARALGRRLGLAVPGEERHAD